MKTVLDFQRMKRSGEVISMVTAYDFWSAQLVSRSNVDCVLVGDSAAMVMHGHDSTVYADIEMMTWHTQMVSRAVKDKFIVGDLPFLTFRKDLNTALDAVEALVKAGAHAVKLEGVEGHEAIVKHLVQSGVPVMGHLGLTPQSVHQLGGFRVQGTTDDRADELRRHALMLEELGCFSLVLECVPHTLAKKITDELSIPTIGIGAGVHTDGQILVLHDLLGLTEGFKPKFLRRYLDGAELIANALNQFDREVKQKQFPSIEESYE